MYVCLDSCIHIYLDSCMHIYVCINISYLAYCKHSHIAANDYPFCPFPFIHLTTWAVSYLPLAHAPFVISLLHWCITYVNITKPLLLWNTYQSIHQSISCRLHNKGWLHWFSNTRYLLPWLHTDRLLFAHSLVLSFQLYTCLPLTRLPLTFPSNLVRLYRSPESFNMLNIFYLFFSSFISSSLSSLPTFLRHLYAIVSVSMN